MRRFPISLAGMAAIAACAPAVLAQDTPPSPNEIVAQAPADDWRPIAAEDLLVMRLEPAEGGEERQVVIQLISGAFAQDWVTNIQTLARAGSWDDAAVVRVQDNYVVQWGIPPAAEGEEAAPLPDGLSGTDESGYASKVGDSLASALASRAANRTDPYASVTTHFRGWPVASDGERAWPVHCYGMVGVGRGMSPDAGSGAELYTVIGHAPRHLDRNIAVVGRVVEGIEHLSSLPRGTGPLGFYESAEERTAIASVRLASDLTEEQRPGFEYLATDSEAFARYADARANRRDPFFIVPAGGADICNVPVPVRRLP